MRSRVFLLLKTQYLNTNLLNRIRHEEDKKHRDKDIGMCVAYGILIFMLLGYSFGMAFAYGILGMARMIPSLSLTATAVMSLVFTFLKSNSVMFAYRDYDMLMSLPFTTKEIIASKFLYMLIGNVLFGLGIMLPMGAAYLIFTKGSMMEAVVWFLFAVFAPLLPMTLATLLGACIVRVGMKQRSRVFLQTAVTMVFIIGVMIFSFRLQTMQEAEMEKMLVDMAPVLEKYMIKIYPLSYLFVQAVCKKSLGALLGFLGLSVGAFFVMVWFVAHRYIAINTALRTHRATKEYQLTREKKKSVLASLAQNEFRRFTSSSLYMTNMGVGLILIILLAIGIQFVDVDGLLLSIEFPLQKEQLVWAVPFVVSVFVGMTVTTAVSFSLEGKNYWILQSLPITKKGICQGKILFNLELTLPVAILANMLIGSRLGMSFGAALLLLVGAVVMCLLQTMWGMLMGVLFCKLDWENEIEVIKQSAAAGFGMMGNMFGAMILTALVIILSVFMPGSVAVAGVLVGLLGISGLFYFLVGLRCEKMQ